MAVSWWLGPSRGSKTAPPQDRQFVEDGREAGPWVPHHTRPGTPQPGSQEGGPASSTAAQDPRLPRVLSPLQGGSELAPLLTCSACQSTNKEARVPEKLADERRVALIHRGG